jgi:hypothetical protein
MMCRKGNEKSPWHEEHVTGAFRREGLFNSSTEFLLSQQSDVLVD